MNTTVIGIIVGMAAVTYIPRLLPGLLFTRSGVPEWVEKWLQNVPYAALGALIFPGIIQGEKPIAGMAGGLTAVVLGLLELHLVLVMALAIFVAFTVSYFL
ncbi:MAG: AzlD domain-containing protein [Anaerolineae bacterium]|nr:MAG: AzlD domain-containing protein [Anaerolineae bacterium]